MSSPGLLLLLLLLAAPPLQPSWLPPPDTPEGKTTITGFILSALDRATSFLKKRLPEINLDGVVGFLMLDALWLPEGLYKPSHIYNNIF